MSKTASWVTPASGLLSTQSGTKGPSWSLPGGRKGTWSDPAGLFQPYQSEEAQQLAALNLSQGQSAAGKIGAMDFSPYADIIWNRALGLDTGAAGEEGLWNVQSRRLLESLRPALAARGLLTSGPGMNIESEKLGELSTEFTSRAFEREAKRQELLQAAAQGLAFLKSLPVQLQTALIAALTGAQAPGTAPSVLQQYGGGQGLAALFGKK